MYVYFHCLVGILLSEVQRINGTSVVFLEIFFYIIKNVVCTTNQCPTFRGGMISPANIYSVLQSSFIVYGIIVVFIAFFVLHTIKVRKECKKLVFTLQCNRITHVNLTFLKHDKTTLCILTQLKNFKSKNVILRWKFS